MNICALLATYNEERFVAAWIEHLLTQDVTVYLIDNESTDETVRVAEAILTRHRDRGMKVFFQVDGSQSSSQGLPWR